MNWGHKIAIVIILFVFGMLGMVYFASLQTNEMIDDNYYQKELAYQEIIDAQKNLLDLGSGDLISQTKSDIVISFPEVAFGNLERGHIELLRPDAQSKDFNMPLIPTNSNQRFINKADLSQGIYKARIRWTNGGKEYYTEESLFVQ